MSNELTVTICSGTACYVQGGSFLFDINEQLTEDEKKNVSVRAQGCLGVCGNRENTRPPFAKINDEILGDLTTESLLSEIRRRLKQTREK